jgi:DNA invertase Pin-like site-specific DNA recombinase
LSSRESIWGPYHFFASRSNAKRAAPPVTWQDGNRRDALKRAGCEKIIDDTVSGGTVQRPGLERVHDALRSGDVLAVWRLDRLGRSLKHLIELMAELEAERIGFQSVTESIDTTTPGGKLVFHIFGALAEFERNLIRERTYAGLAAARARGRKGGSGKAW